MRPEIISRTGRSISPCFNPITYPERNVTSHLSFCSHRKLRRFNRLSVILSLMAFDDFDWRCSGRHKLFVTPDAEFVIWPVKRIWRDPKPASHSTAVAKTMVFFRPQANQIRYQPILSVLTVLMHFEHAYDYARLVSRASNLALPKEEADSWNNHN